MIGNRGTRRLVALVAGLALDALLGDPREWPHPVRMIGKQIDWGQRLARQCLVPRLERRSSHSLTRDQAELFAGGVVAAGVALPAPVAMSWVLRTLEKMGKSGKPGRIGPGKSATGDAEGASAASASGSLAFLIATAIETILFYQLIAVRSLRDESMCVYEALERGDIEAARNAVGMIVGRDTDMLDAQGVARAAVETVAENASDGVVAPLLAMGLGGAPAVLFYKAVNTLDSMMGYKNECYINLGRAAAKLDDAVNFIPARVSGALMCAAAGIAGFDARTAWRIFRRDRLNHASPNSAHTEAACAGALGVQLGGPSRYFGEMVDKPTIGDNARAIEAADISRANRLMLVTAVLAALLSAGLAVKLQRCPGQCCRITCGTRAST